MPCGALQLERSGRANSRAICAAPRRWPNAKRIFGPVRSERVGGVTGRLIEQKAALGLVSLPPAFSWLRTLGEQRGSCPPKGTSR